MEILQQSGHPLLPVTPRYCRSFGLVFSAACLLAAMWPVFKGHEPRLVWLWPAALLLALALARPLWLRAPAGLWMKFGLLLGHVIAPISMAIVFFLTVLPIGILLRMFGKDILGLRYDPAAKSYWVRRDPPGPSGDSLNNQF